MALRLRPVLARFEMGQYYQPTGVAEIQGESIESTDEEILAAVRAVLTAEEVTHPDVERDHNEAISRNRFWDSAPKPQRAAAAAEAKPSLVLQLFDRLRG